MPRKKTTAKKVFTGSGNILEKLETEVHSNQSKVSLVLGALIILVIGVLVFNYFNRNKTSLGPAQQTQKEEDLSPDKLPGKYTVKEGDTLFIIAQKYYADGEKFLEIAKANNLIDADQIEAGQTLELPRLKVQQAQASPPVPSTQVKEESLGTGGGNNTIWGPRIEGDTYTVTDDDWLSKIAGRAYGDIMAFDKIAQANNIADPDHIEPGMVLAIPR